jgi:hypothetical protein
MLRGLLVTFAAGALLAYCVGLVFYSDRFPPPGREGAAAGDIKLFVGATLLVSFLHVLACVAVHRRPPRLRHVLLVGAAVRVLLLFGAPDPVLEGDPARQRFDARLVNQGIHPYEFKPAHLQDEEPRDIVMTGVQVERLIRARAAMTASADAPRPEETTRPDLRSTAMPLQLWIGAVADRFKPSSTRGFAYVILVADSLAMFFLVLALRRLCLPVGWLIAYAWSPVLLKEAYCSLSPDILVLPALALLVWCLASGRRLLASIPLALCGGLRLPLLTLLPVCARRVGVLGLMLSIVLLVAPFLPLQTPDVPMRRYIEGSVHTWRHCEYNSSLENVLRAGLSQVPAEAENTLVIAGVPLLTPGDALGIFVAKLIGLFVVLGVMVYLVIRWGAAPEGMFETGLGDVFIMLVTLLFVSPVLQPAQALWLLPILVVRPAGISWFALPGLACLSYLTHLVGPQAADLTFLDGELSFRVFEYGAFAFLLFIDLLWRRRIFTRLDEAVATTLLREEEAAQPSPREPALT